MMMMLLIKRLEYDDDVADQSVVVIETEDEDYMSKMMKGLPMIYKCITLMMLKMISLLLLLMLMLL